MPSFPPFFSPSSSSTCYNLMLVYDFHLFCLSGPLTAPQSHLWLYVNPFPSPSDSLTAGKAAVRPLHPASQLGRDWWHTGLLLHGWRGTDPSKQAVPWCQTPLISTDGLCPPCQAPLGHHLAEPKVLAKGVVGPWSRKARRRGEEGKG